MTPRTAPTAYLDSVDSPAGAVEFAVDAQGALVVVNMLGGKYPRSAAEDLAILGFVPERDPANTGTARQQLEEYFRGERLSFDLPVAFHGTAWQVTVWQALMNIPFGETRTYGQIAS